MSVEITRWARGATEGEESTLRVDEDVGVAEDGVGTSSSLSAQGSSVSWNDDSSWNDESSSHDESWNDDSSFHDMAIYDTQPPKVSNLPMLNLPRCVRDRIDSSTCVPLLWAHSPDKNMSHHQHDPPLHHPTLTPGRGVTTRVTD